MDTLKLINSKDIRDYLKQINYQFTPQESAWLIWRSRHIPVEEKYTAWEELIETTPDCELPDRFYIFGDRKRESFHSFLKRYMKVEKKHLDTYFNKEKTPDRICIYRVEYKELIKESGLVYKSDMNRSFSSYKDAYKALEEKKAEYLDDEYYELFSAKIICTELGEADNFNNKVNLDKDLNIVVTDFCSENKEEMRLFAEGFFLFWFDIPTPFKKGDIIHDPDDAGAFYYGGGPLVVTSVGLDGMDEEKKERIRNRHYLDNSDMCVFGYFQDEDGYIYSECSYNYMDYEYYKGSLNGKKRVLKALSKCLKEEVEPADFGVAYHVILTEEYLKNFKRWYSDDHLEAIGVEGEDDE